MRKLTQIAVRPFKGLMRLFSDMKKDIFVCFDKRYFLPCIQHSHVSRKRKVIETQTVVNGKQFFFASPCFF